MAAKSPVPLSGRRAEAARNDQIILDAARAVFTANPEAPIAAVAERAGVGIRRLYGRYGGKGGMLQGVGRPDPMAQGGGSGRRMAS